MNNNMFLCCFVTLLCSILIQDIHSNSHESFDSIKYGIVGGWLTTIEKHPYQVSIQVVMKRKKKFHCGGSIISPRFILTAAHCIEGVSLVEIRAGSSFKSKRGTVYKSTQMVLHPYYNPNTFDYDVAVIDLQINMTLDGKTTKNIYLPPLTSSVLQPGTDLLVSGWGHTSHEGEFSEQLRVAIVPTVFHEDCRNMYPREHFITSRMICAGYIEGGIDSCQGDSGGPAVDRETGVQMGVVSWGLQCAHPNLPGVYADLTNNEIRQWIYLITGV